MTTTSETIMRVPQDVIKTVTEIDTTTAIDTVTTTRTANDTTTTVNNTNGIAARRDTIETGEMTITMTLMMMITTREVRTATRAA